MKFKGILVIAVIAIVSNMVYSKYIAPKLGMGA
jgi:hypothetical protein